MLLKREPVVTEVQSMMKLKQKLFGVGTQRRSPPPLSFIPEYTHQDSPVEPSINFSEVCSLAIDHVYFGGEGVANQLEILNRYKITHVINCVKAKIRNKFENQFKYFTLHLKDSENEDILSVLYDVFDFIEEARDSGGRVYIHCVHGISRSAALVIAYVMWKEKQGFYTSRDQIQNQREVIDPNTIFCTQLISAEERFHPSTMVDFLRIYRLKSHSELDPGYLVPSICVEMLKEGEIVFDPRGTFVIHIQNALVIWIGKKASFAYLEAARRFVRQLRRYENVPGVALSSFEVHQVTESESVEFMSSLNTITTITSTITKTTTENSTSVIKYIEAREQDHFSLDYELFSHSSHTMRKMESSL